MGSLYRRKGVRAWWMTYQTADGRRRRQSTRTSDKATASQVLAAAERLEAKIAAGVLDETSLQAARSQREKISIAIEAYHDEKAAGDVSKEYAKSEKLKLDRLALEAKWDKLEDMTIESLVNWQKLRGDLSDRTRQAYGRLAKSFADWAFRRGRSLKNPFADFKPAAHRERIYHRRALTELEWSHLRGYLAEAPDRRGKSGHLRELLYEFALVTGCRASEIASLTANDLNLSARPPYCRVRASISKNAKSSEQFLTSSLAISLEAHVRHKLPGSRLFDLGDITRLAAILRADIEAARDRWLAQSKDIDERRIREESDFLRPDNHAGERLDFHSLRHTCGAWLALRGVHPKAIQRVMRHSKITLTLDTYGHLFPEQETAALAALEKAVG